MQSEHRLSYLQHLGLMWAVSLFVIGLAVALDTCTTKPAHAELYLDAAGGISQFFITAADGDYLQKGLPHSLDTSSLAYRVGLGWSFNKRWAVRASYLNLGSVKQSANFVADADYNAKQGRCTANCANAAPYVMSDNYKGLEAIVTRSFALSGKWSLQASLGGAYLDHRFTINKNAGTNDESHRNKGQFIATVLSGGACYAVFCAEASYYHGLGGSNGFMGQDQGWPLSKEIVVSWLNVKIPLFN